MPYGNHPKFELKWTKNENKIQTAKEHKKGFQKCTENWEKGKTLVKERKAFRKTKLLSQFWILGLHTNIHTSINMYVLWVHKYVGNQPTFFPIWISIPLLYFCTNFVPLIFPTLHIMIWVGDQEVSGLGERYNMWCVVLKYNMYRLHFFTCPISFDLYTYV